MYTSFLSFRTIPTSHTVLKIRKPCRLVCLIGNVEVAPPKYLLRFAGSLP